MNAQNAPIAFSIGQRVRDAKRLKQISGTFDDLVARLRPDGHTAKDGPYICGPMRDGQRSTATALPVAFAALDLDAIPAAAALEAIVEAARRWRCFVYTTFSHKPAEGIFKARILFELDREVSRSEYPQVCAALAAELEQAAGVPVVIDESCSKPEQPLFTAREGSQVWDHHGEPACVDSLVQAFGQRAQLQTVPIPVPEATDADDDPFFGAPPSAAVEREVRSALAYLDPDPYELWIKTGHALKSLGETGRKLWHEWSERSDKYDCETAEVKWASFKPERTGYAAIFAEAQRLGWVNPRAKARAAQYADELLADGGHPLAQFIELGDYPKPPRWIVPGFIAHGVVVFAGGHGVGKTTAILPLALTVAGLHEDGSPLAPAHWRHVIYISEDTGQAQRIVTGYRKHLGLSAELLHERLHLVDALRMPAAEVAAVGEAYREQFTRRIECAGPDGTTRHVELPPLVVIDTMSATIEMEEENSNTEASAAIAAFKQRFAGLPLWLVGHVSKANVGRTDTLSLRGASAFEADAHQTVFLIRDGDAADAARWLKLGKVRFEPAWPELQIENGRCEVFTEDEFGNPGTMLLYWGIAKPPQASRKDQAALAAGQARARAEIELREAIVAAVTTAWVQGNPLNRAGVKAVTSGNASAKVQCIERLLAERRLHEVFIQSGERVHPRRDSFLVPLTEDERNAVRRGEPLPESKLAVPATWRKPAKLPAAA